jgi:hypothetical protein
VVSIPNGGGGEDLNLGDLIGYNNSVSKPPGDQTPQEQNVVEDVEQRVDSIAGGWTETPQADPREVLERAGVLAADIAGAVRQWARPGSERRQLEMIGILVKELTKRDRELLNLKARLDASPY